MTYDDPSIALLDDPSLRGLPAPVCWQYARLIRLAGRCQAGGVLALAGRPLGVERLAQELGVELSELQVALRLLQGAGLVAHTEGAWMLPHMMYAAAMKNWSLRSYWREKKRLSRSRKAAASKEAHTRSRTILLPPDPDTAPAAIAQQSIPDTTPGVSGEQDTFPILLTDDYAQNFPDASEPTSSDPPFGDPPSSGPDPAPDPLPGADPSGKVGYVKDTSADTSTDTSIDTSRDLSAEKSMIRGKKRRQLIKHIDIETGTLNDCLTPGANIASSPSPNNLSPPETHPPGLDPPGAERPGGACAPRSCPVDLIGSRLPHRAVARRESSPPGSPHPPAAEPAKGSSRCSAAQDNPTRHTRVASRSQHPARCRRKKPAAKSPAQPSPAVLHFRHCYPAFNLTRRTDEIIQQLERRFGTQRVIESIDWTVMKGIPQNDVLHSIHVALPNWRSPAERYHPPADRPGSEVRQPPPGGASAEAATAEAATDPDELYLLQNPNGPLRQQVEERLRQRRQAAQNGDSP